MSTITFDTLKFVEKLEKAGVPREQAKAKAEAEALAEVLDSGAQELVTKKDMLIALGDLRADIMKWVIGPALAQVGLLVAILLRMPR
jgi:soluble P-type ATPase